MPNNKVDGIKKLNKKDLEKSRNIVLASINEEFKKGEKLLEQEAKRTKDKKPSKKVDGIFASFKSKPEEKKVSEKDKKQWKKEINKVVKSEKQISQNEDNLEESDETKKQFVKAPEIIKKKKKEKPKMKVSNEAKKAVNDVLAGQIKEDEELKFKEERIRKMQFLKQQKIEEEKKKAALAMKKKEEEEQKRKQEITEYKIQEKKLALQKKEEDKKSKEKEHRRKEKEKQREIERKKKKKEQLKKEREAFKKMQEEARRKTKEKAKKEKERKRKKRIRKRKTLIKKYKLKIKGLYKYLRFRTFKLIKKVIYFVTVFIVIILILYFIFISSVLKFDIDNGLSRSIAKFVPVPAFATNDGIIEYYTYKDLKNNIKLDAGDDINQKIQALAIKEIAINNLMEKYGISLLDFEDHNKMMEFLKDKAIYDNTINQVGINRIKKIKDMIDENNDFIRIASKFGDETGKITIKEDADLNKLEIKQASLKDLKVNEVSDIIFSKDGYYIFRCYHKAEEETALNYLFIKAKTLDDYLIDYIKDYKLLSFID